MNQSASDNRRISKSIHRKAAIVSPLPHNVYKVISQAASVVFLLGILF
jgi:hypothetical protein